MNPEQQRIEHIEVKMAVLSQFLQTKDVALLNILNQLGGAEFSHFHFNMLRDHGRNAFYQKFITQNVKDKVVLDIGAGIGYLSLLSLQNGAKKVYAIEYNWMMITVLRHKMQKYIEDGRFVLIDKNAMEVELSDLEQQTPDIVLHEIFSSNGLAEGVLKVLSSLHQKNIIKQSSVFPHQIDLYVQAVEIKSVMPNSEVAAENNQFEELNILAPLFIEDITSHIKYGKDWFDTGSVHKIASTLLNQIHTENKITHTIKLNPNENYLRFWFETSDRSNSLKLSNDLAKVESHWSNKVFKIPQTLMGKEVEVTFFMTLDQLYVWEIK